MPHELPLLKAVFGKGEFCHRYFIFSLNQPAVLTFRTF
jgi:hypothetical protein